VKAVTETETGIVYREDSSTYLGYIVIAALVAAWTGFMLSIAPYSTEGGDIRSLTGKQPEVVFPIPPPVGPDTPRPMLDISVAN